MQIVATGDNLHEMSTPVFLEKYETYHQLLPAELRQRVFKVNSWRNTQI